MPTPELYPDVRPQPFKRDVVDSGNPHADMRVDTATGTAIGKDIVTGKYVKADDYERAINPIPRDAADQAPAKLTGTSALAGALSGDAKPADQGFEDNGDGPDVGGTDGTGGSGSALDEDDEPPATVPDDTP